MRTRSSGRRSAPPAAGQSSKSSKTQRALPGERSVLIHELDGEARGVGRDEESGAEVRLPGVIPGERVRAQIVHASKRGVQIGELREVLLPAPERVASPCPNFLVCGGCDFLHANMDFQLVSKRAQVAAALGLEPDAIDPVIPSPSPFHYRALAKFVVGPGPILGSYRPRSHDVVDMRGCQVHAPVVEGVADFMRDALAAYAGPVDLRYVLIRASLAEQRCVVTLVARSAAAQCPRWLAGVLEQRPEVARVILHVHDSEGDNLLAPGESSVLLDRGLPVERLGATELTLDSGVFAQVNPQAAQSLYARVTELVDPRDKVVLDLYGGSGGIGLALAQAGARQVHGVEANAGSVQAANHSAEQMGFGARVQYQAASVEEGLITAPHSDAIVINPPRKGVSRGVLLALAERRPFRLVYVSCNPESLARDLGILRALNPELVLRRVTPVDLFPQTRHVETVLAADLP